MKRASLVLFLFSLAGCGAFATAGTPCTKHEQCTGLKDGYCARSEICTRECSEKAPCPDGSACFTTPSAAICPPIYSACSSTTGRSVCLPTCEKDSECPSTAFACTDGLCQVKAALNSLP